MLPLAVDWRGPNPTMAETKTIRLRDEWADYPRLHEWTDYCERPAKMIRATIRRWGDGLYVVCGPDIFIPTAGMSALNAASLYVDQSIETRAWMSGVGDEDSVRLREDQWNENLQAGRYWGQRIVRLKDSQLVFKFVCGKGVERA